MTGIPTVNCYLDDGSGAWATDITSRVSLRDSVSVSGMGRSSEFYTAEPAQLSLTLENLDGTMSDGSTIVPGQPVRVAVSSGGVTRNRFTGRVSALSLGWPTGGQEYSTVALTAADCLAELSRRTLRSFYENEIVGDMAAWFYTLGDAAGSLSAGDTSGNGNPALVPAGSGTAVSPGTGTGPGTDGLTATQFFGGQYLYGSNLTPLSTGAFTLEFWFRAASAPATAQMILWADNASAGGGVGSLQVTLNATGKVTAALYGASGSAGVTSTEVLSDGAIHYIAVTFDGATTLSLDIGGGSFGTTTSASAPYSPFTRLAVGGDPTGVYAPFVGTLAHVAGFATASSLQAFEHFAVGVLGYLNETASARFARILAWAGITDYVVADMADPAMASQSVQGISVADALQQVATTEGGVLFVNGDGVVTLQGRYYRALHTSPDATLTADDIDSGTLVDFDDQQYLNDVTVTTIDGATTVASDPVAIDAKGDYATSIDLASSDAQLASSVAQWTLAKHSVIKPRLASVVFDLMTSTDGEWVLGSSVGTFFDIASVLFNLSIGDHLALTDMPTQMFDAVTDLTVEGWSETISDTGWTVTANLLPFALAEMFIFDDPTYGVLDGAPLGY